MVLPISWIIDLDSSPIKKLLIDVDAFLEAHYKFRCEEEYKGHIGVMRACEDSREEEERERFGDRAYSHPPGVYGSEPPFWGVNLEKLFSDTLLELIEAKGKSNVEIYKRANIDRKLFSKICSQEGYLPSKKTVIALALALELSLDETQDLLRIAGFTLSRSILFDSIIEYFISQGNYDIFEINEVLSAYNLRPLN